MSGILLTSGQVDILNVYFLNTAVRTTLYLGLMTNTTNPTVGQQLGSGITEVSGTGYNRITLTRNTDWSILSDTITAAQKTFTVGSGGWSAVNGYFVALSSGGADAVMAEAFEAQRQGDKLEGDIVKVTVNYQQKDNSQ